MDLQEWRQMDSLADNVIARAPADRSARRLDRLRMVHHMSELRLKAGKGLHSDNPVSGSHDMNWDATLYGPPVADNWRLFAGTRYAQGISTKVKASAATCWAALSGAPVTSRSKPSSPATAITAKTGRAHGSQQLTA